MNIKIIKLDINKPIYEKIQAKQGDTKSRYLLFHLLDGAIPFSLNGRTVRVYGLKPDNKEIFNDLQIVDATRGICKLELTSQALAVPGNLDLELVIMEGESKLSSIPFVVEVLKSLNSKSAIESSNEYKALDRSLIEVEAWNKEFAEKSGKLEELYTPRLNEVSSQLAENTNEIKDIEIDITKYGVIGDGTDETFKMQNIINEAKIGSKLTCPNGKTFKFKSLSISKSIKFNFKGSKIEQIQASTIEEDKPLFNIRGEETTVNTNITNCRLGNNFITVEDPLLFSKQSYIKIYDNNPVKNDKGEFVYYGRQQLLKISNITNNNLILDGVLEYDYVAAKIALINNMPIVEVKDCYIKDSTHFNFTDINKAPHPIYFYLCQSPIVENVIVSDFMYHAINFQACINSKVKDSYAFSPTNIEAGRGYFTQFSYF